MFEALNNFYVKTLNSTFAPGDSEDLIIKKRMLVLITLIVASAGFVWGVIYLFLDRALSATLPFLYTFISVVGLIHLVKTKDLRFFQSAQIIAILLIPFALMWSLGGFMNGSYVMLWAFYAPTAAVIYGQTHNPKRWYIAFALLTIFSVLIDDYLVAHFEPLNDVGIKLFLALNLLVSFGGILLLLNYFVSIKKEASDFKLQEKHEELMQKSTELELANIKLEHQVLYDDLTSLPNRFQFLNTIIDKHAAVDNENESMAILMIDLDNFKEINNSLGHEIGDKVIIEIAEMLQKMVKKGDMVARLGGDEFALLLTKLNGTDYVQMMAKSILHLLEEAIMIDGHELYVSASIGISLYPLDSHECMTLLRNADSAMNRVKEYGKNSYEFYETAMTDKARKRVSLEAKLRHAIENDEFIVFYQPQYDTEQKCLTGCEALVRWQSPELGMVSPAEFIPLAEETGLIVSIDRIVLSKAIEAYNRWYAMGYNAGRLSLNLAMKQLQKEDLIPFLKHQINKITAPTMFIDLEVTEGDIMRNPQESIKLLQEINALGINLAIDDFGTGYSSLAYLKKLPVNKLKIDQSFVFGLPSDEDDVSIVKTVIALAEGMKLNVLAEGVETQEQSDFLLANGCKYVQGYFYGRPMPEHEFEILLSSGGVINS